MYNDSETKHKVFSWQFQFLAWLAVILMNGNELLPYMAIHKLYRIAIARSSCFELNVHDPAIQLSCYCLLQYVLI